MVLTTTENSDCCQVIAIRAFIVVTPVRRVALQLVRLAREALDQLHRAERLVEPAEQLGLELLHPLFAVDQRPRVVAQAQVHERHDGQRQQRDRHVQPQQDAEHHRQRGDRRGQREQAAHHEVLDRVRVDVDAVDRVRRARGDVMVQAERRQVREQLAAQVVDHPLAGVDLHLGAVGRDELVHDLKQHAGDDDEHQQREPMALRRGGNPRRQPGGERLARRARSRSRPPSATAAAHRGRFPTPAAPPAAPRAGGTGACTGASSRAGRQWRSRSAGSFAASLIRPPCAAAAPAAAARGSAQSSE